MALGFFKTAKGEYTSFILTGLLVLFIIVGVSAFMIIKNQRRNNDLLSIEKDLMQYQQDVENIVNKAVMSSQSAALSLSTTKIENNLETLTRGQANSILLEVLRRNEDFFAVFSAWEINAFDRNDDLFVNLEGHDQTGRFIPFFYRNSDDEIVLGPLKYLNNPDVNQFYEKTKKTHQTEIIEPYIYNTEDGNQYVFAITSPIMYKYTFYGIVGICFHVDYFQALLKNKTFVIDNANISIISNSGIYFASRKNEQLIGQQLSKLYDNGNEQESIIRNGEKYHKIKGDSVYFFRPLFQDTFETPWQIRFSATVEEVFPTNYTWFYRFMAINFLFFLIVFILLYYYQSWRNKSLYSLKQAISNIIYGNYEDVEIRPGHLREYAELNHVLKSLTESLKEIHTVVVSITNGDFSKFVSTEKGNTVLARSINELNKDLEQTKFEFARQQELAGIRNWNNQGIAELSVILRKSYEKEEDLAFEIIKQLVNHLDASLSGLYIYDDSSPHDIKLRLIAAFAYDRRKYLEAELKPGEGLVGACAMEKQTIFLTKVPEEYLKITSGIGTTKPKSLLITPLKIEDKIYGVLEIASLIVFKDYHIEFVEKAAESIALTLSTVKINARTAELLEQSQQQAEELSVQEEEMRQNLEEMKIIQEGAKQREAEMTGILSAINSSFLTAELDMNGFVTRINTAYLELLRIHEKDALGSHHTSLGEKINPSEKYSAFWKDLSSGITIRIDNEKIKLSDGTIISLMQTFAPIFDSEGKPYKILNIAVNLK